MPRKSTFNVSETNKLFEISANYKNIIECKKTDCVSSKQKDEAWENIAVEFNATSDIPCDAKDLQTKYKNVKYTTKSKAAENRRNVYGTGGGPAKSSTSLSAVEEKMMDMLNDKELEGVANTCDSNAAQNPILENAVADCHLESGNNLSPTQLETPQSGPATLRTQTSAPL